LIEKINRRNYNLSNWRTQRTFNERLLEDETL
jgi:hypothetical protein